MSGPLSCLRKKHFDTEAKAQSVIYRMRAKRQDVERLEVYECRFCHKWHIGHTEFAAAAPKGAE